MFYSINSNLNNKSNSGHIHDDRYYTEDEIESKLSQLNNISSAKLGAWGVLYKIGKIVILLIDTNVNVDIPSTHTWMETIPDGYKPIWGIRAAGDISFSSASGGGSFGIFINTNGAVTFIPHIAYDASKGNYIYGAQVTWVTS